MRIKTKFNVITVIYLVFVVSLILILFLTSQRVTRLEEGYRTSEELVKDVFELNIVTDDYLMHPNERASQQWQIKYDSIENMLEMLDVDTPEKQNILNSIKETYESIESNFASLKKPDISSELRNRLNSQLLIKSQIMVAKTSSLAEANYQEEVIVQQRARWITYIFIIIMSLLIILTWLMVTKISMPIQKLRDVAAKIGAGNFKIKADIKTNDELEELGNAINKMSVDLQEIKFLEGEKAMKEALEKEVGKKTTELDKKLKEAEDARTATMNILEDIDEARHELEMEDIRKNELFNITSHELKTPLVPIQGYLDLVLTGKQGKINEKQRESLSTVERNSKRLGRLIEDVLDIARIQSKKMKFNFEMADPSIVIKDAVKGMESGAKKEKIYLKLNIKPLPKVYVDPSRMMQVITNLIGNALKFTTKGGITVSAYSKEGSVFIEVKDTGAGIKPEDREKIFERFFQVDSSITRKYGGTGLGLAISRGICKAQGGDITIKSQFGKGSTFTVKIPAGKKIKKKEFGLYGFMEGMDAEPEKGKE